MNAHERTRFEALQEDRRTVEAAAGWLRAGAWEDGYAGLADKDRCFMIALLLETLSLQLDRLPEGLRGEIVRASQWLMSGSRVAMRS